MEREKRPNRIKDLTGQRFGKLVVLGLHDRVMTPCGSIKTRFACACDCGNKTITKRSNLVNGYTSSCGCMVREVLMKRNTTHGESDTRTYFAWKNMKMRCLNNKSRHFHRYGGRGISICERWMSFANFLTDMGRAQANMTIERIDNDGNYEPSNCRWATRKEQARNKSTTVRVEHNGQSISLVEACEHECVNYYTTHHHIRKKKMTIQQSIAKQKGLRT